MNKVDIRRSMMTIAFAYNNIYSLQYKCNRSSFDALSRTEGDFTNITNEQFLVTV